MTEEAISSLDTATSAIEQALVAGGKKDLVEAITRKVMEEMRKG